MNEDTDSESSDQEINLHVDKELLDWERSRNKNYKENNEEMFKTCDEEWDAVLREVLETLQWWESGRNRNLKRECKVTCEKISTYLIKWDDIFAEKKAYALAMDNIEELNDLEENWKNKQEIAENTKDHVITEMERNHLD